MAQSRWLGLLLGSLWACNSGPISEFPVIGAPTSEGGKSPDVAIDGGAPIGSGSSSSADAATAPPFNSTSDGGLTPASDSGADSVDHNPGEGDAGDPGDCPVLNTSSVMDPQCVGDFCGISRSELAAESSFGGACTDDTAALAAVCSGALPTRVADCAQRELAAGSVPSADSLVACLALAPEPLGNTACGRCFADEVSCAIGACSAAFLSGDEQAADHCRGLVCAPRFAVCSGLPIHGF